MKLSTLTKRGSACILVDCSKNVAGTPRFNPNEMTEMDQKWLWVFHPNTSQAQKPYGFQVHIFYATRRSRRLLSQMCRAPRGEEKHVWTCSTWGKQSRTEEPYHSDSYQYFENLRESSRFANAMKRVERCWTPLDSVGLRWTRWCFEHFGTRSSLLLDWALSQNDWWPQAVEFSQLGTANRIKTDVFFKREQEWTSRLHRHAEVPWTDFPLKAKKFKTLRRRIERERECVCVYVYVSHEH